MKTWLLPLWCLFNGRHVSNQNNIQQNTMLQFTYSTTVDTAYLPSCCMPLFWMSFFWGTFCPISFDCVKQWFTDCWVVLNCSTECHYTERHFFEYCYAIIASHVHHLFNRWIKISRIFFLSRRGFQHDRGVAERLRPLLRRLLLHEDLRGRDRLRQKGRFHRGRHSPA